MRLYWYKEEANWGDSFTPYLFQKLYNVNIEWAPPHQSEGFGCGSILELVPKDYKGHILGTGIIDESIRVDLSKAKVHALRGHLTFKLCSINPAFTPIFGDLGLLASELIDNIVLDKPLYTFGIIPHHYKDREHESLDSWRLREDTRIIDIRRPGKELVEEVSKCKYIVSSSLHGLIVADSLGIPNSRIKLNPLKGGDFKFRDYLSVYGEDDIFFHDISEAFNKVKQRNANPIKRNLKGLLDYFVHTYLIK